MTLLMVLMLAGLPDDPPTSCNAEVLAFARERVGQKVGNGECATLAIDALRSVGVRFRVGEDGPDWGEPRAKLEDAQPGDILQFRDVTFFERKKLKGGGVATKTYTFPQHTAIVSGVKIVKGELILTFLHQNAGFVDEDEAQRKLVSEWTLGLSTLKGGTIRAYQPVRR